MFFKNLSIFRMPEQSKWSRFTLNEALSLRPLSPCADGSMQSLGWVSPRDNVDFVHIVNQQILIALGVEQKILPASVVKQFANEKARAIEESEGRRVGRKEMRELREAAALELLPKAFVRTRTTQAWIDPINGFLVVNSASPTRAEELLEHLRKTVDGIPVKMLHVNQTPIGAMTSLVAEGDAPEGFTIDHDLVLASADRSKVSYVKHSLDGEDIRQHIAAGKIVTRLAMTWRDKISFVLDENMQIRRLSFLDILKYQNEGQAEDEAERFDLDFTLMTGELALLITDMVAALGGECPA